MVVNKLTARSCTCTKEPYQRSSGVTGRKAMCVLGVTTPVSEMHGVETSTVQSTEGFVRLWSDVEKTSNVTPFYLIDLNRIVKNGLNSINMAVFSTGDISRHWRQVLFFDEFRFLLHRVDDRIRVCSVIQRYLGDCVFRTASGRGP